MIKHIVLLARPHQYTKNLFIFLPAFFACRIACPDVFLSALIAFISFCLVSSAVYILNDWKDRDEDRLHPDKRLRPIASGSISPMAAFVLLLLFLTGGGFLALYSSISIFLLVLLYFLLNIAYSFKLKQVPIIDISLVSSGFVIRLFVGAEATEVELSQWIIVMTFLLALFLSLSKRRHDMLVCSKLDPPPKTIDGYNLKFLDFGMVMSASIVVLAYILWSLSPGVSGTLSGDNLYLTSIFVILGVLRYMQVSFVEEGKGDPSSILIRDKGMQLVILSWAGSLLWVYY